MKRVICVIAAFAAVVIGFSLSAAASSPESILSGIEDQVEYGSLLELIPEESLEVLEQIGLDLSGDDTVPDFSSLVLFCVYRFAGVLVQHLPLLSVGVILLILMKILTQLKPSDDTLTEGLAYLAVIGSGVYSFAVTEGVLRSLVSVADRSASFLTAALPVALSATALSGGTMGTTVLAATLPTLFTVFSSLVSSLFYPLCLFCYAASVCGFFREGISLRPLISSVRKFCNRGVEILSGLAIGVFCVQRAAVSAADSFARRSLRFALAQLIPVAGGPLTEGIETVYACGKSLSGKVGVLCVLVLIGLFATPCILGLLLSFLYSVLASVGDVLQVPVLADFFRDVKDTFATMTCFAICSLAVLAAALLILTGG